MDRVCSVCKGPILVGDRIVGDHHKGCVPEGEPTPVVLDSQVENWGKDTSGAEPYDPIPETCEEALQRWDAGEAIFTVSMGGLGPGYEQAIHLAAMEAVRYLTTVEEMPALDDKKGNERLVVQLEDVIHKADRELNLGGLSGAMEGAAINLASMTKRHGWRKAVRMAPVERRILVSKRFPG